MLIEVFFMKKFVMFLFIVCLLGSIAHADSDYWSAGSNESQFNLDRGIFSLVEELDTTYYTAGMTDTKKMPLVADLDNDGTAEIYILDEDEIKVYEGITLAFQASYDFGDEQRTSYPIIFDIDGDGTEEYIIVLEEDEHMLIMNFSGTELINETRYTLSLTYDKGETIIACRGVDDCAMAYALRPDTCATSNCADLGIIYFNSSKVGNPTILEETGGVGGQNYGGFCRPDVPYINVVDYDLDGDEDYVFSYAQIADADGTEDYGVYVSWVDMTSKVATETQSVLLGSGSQMDNFQIDDLVYCYSSTQVGHSFTSPLMNRYLLDDTGYELVVGYQTSDTEYRMDMYDKDASFKDDFPEADDSNGILLSNVFMADVFPNSNTIGKSFCIVGWDFEDKEQVLTCGSKFKGDLAETNEYIYTITDGYNNSRNYDIGNTIAHSGQQSNALTDGIDLDEIITTYGVFTVDDSSCSWSILGKYVCDADRIYQNGAGSSVFFSSDIEGIGNEDLLAMTNTALYLFDDGISNQPVSSVDAYFNPCPTNTIIKLNETMIITVTGYDGNSDYGLDDDTLTYNVTVYKDTDNELNDTETGVTSGSPRQFSFNLNKTISSGIIEILVTDNINDPLILEQSFTVGNDGVEFGDVTCTYSTTSAEEEGESCDVDDDCDGGEACIDNVCASVGGECTSDDDCADGYSCVTNADGTKECMSSNLIKRGMNEIADAVGVGLIVIFLIFLAGLDYLAIKYAHEYFSGLGSKYLFAVIAIVDIILIIIASLIGVLPFWVLILLILTGIIAGVFFIAHKAQGQEV